MKINFSKMLTDLINERIDIEDILINKSEFNEFANKTISGKVKPNDPELEAFIKLCNDVYSYSVDGEVLIPDSYYDQCMQIYKSGGNDTIVFADMIGKKQWDFIKHEVPGLVGTLDKIYTYKGLKDYLSMHNSIKKFTIAPKFDGISCAIKVKNGKVVYAATRYNGIEGQNITKLVMNAKNYRVLFNTEYLEKQGFPFSLDDGFYKCELCVGTEEFEELKKVKRYSNRRSATAGIVNTPSNLAYAKYVTIVPLVFYDNHHTMYYITPFRKEIDYYSPSDMLDDIEEMLEEIRSKDFPFRVDGVVINPGWESFEYPNEMDLMDNSIAFKINTAEGKTRIKYGYMSIGRLGKAVPMLKVEPVEVNETIVEDVSLGSYDKFLSMDLKEDEEVIVYSAGDVIPQIKLPAMRANLYNKPELKIKKRCPYCGEKLTRVNTEYYCTNNDCPRIITGKITNFLLKIGMEGFSDKTIESICAATNIRKVHDFLHLRYDDILRIPGFESTSAMNLYSEIMTIRRNPISVSQFFGALGIDKISEKKTRKIFEYTTISEVLDSKDKKLDKLYWRLQNSDGIGPKTAAAFIDFIKDNRETIVELYNDVNVTEDIKYKANVVFTGFRPDKETEETIRKLGYDISDGVTKLTVAVFAASISKNSTKIRAANKKGIPIYSASELNYVLDMLEKDELEKSKK